MSKRQCRMEPESQRPRSEPDAPSAGVTDRRHRLRRIGGKVDVVEHAASLARRGNLCPVRYAGGAFSCGFAKTVHTVLRQPTTAIP
jgi:hypothetical protein